MDVAQVMIDELNEADEAFAGNRLLSTFIARSARTDRALGQLIQLCSATWSWIAAPRSSSSLFPVGPTMISMGVELFGGRSVEVASIGREGAVGGIVSCGHAPAFSRAEVLVGGPAFKVPMRVSRRPRAGHPSSRPCSAASPIICCRK